MSQYYNHTQPQFSEAHNDRERCESILGESVLLDTGEEEAVIACGNRILVLGITVLTRDKDLELNPDAIVQPIQSPFAGDQSTSHRSAMNRSGRQSPWETARRTPTTSNEDGTKQNAMMPLAPGFSDDDAEVVLVPPIPTPKGNETRAMSPESGHFSVMEDALPSKDTLLSLQDLRKLLAHGLILPTFLSDLLEQEPYKDIDAKQLFQNMRKILRLVVSQPFSPHDILKALATKSYGGDVLFSMIASGQQITSWMVAQGFRLQSYSDSDLVGPGSQGRMTLDANEFRRVRKKGVQQDQQSGDASWNESEESSDGDDDIVAHRAPKGKVFHFIPNLMMQRDVKPVFYRSLNLEGTPALQVQEEEPPYRVRRFYF
ncbi:hypothetical protein M427DRAFT_39161 [Gonapodya prolifera JEL478]|uniref:Uncharacterized protein n=1 Tax=Gonapodya prolifera (strain JEL478) TaxID=1344416 RepID=A0A138ZXV4_GONPJ|nr:hypothetical protein M427DRAFT_39161 [Gonapodya prolifera JEL478]|eukprot:KXS09316.1 hypothetical protein M427DRAFT_39161 [Gonapodya prolifera JEL478]